MLHLPHLVVADLLAQVETEEVIAGVVRFAHGGDWPSFSITLLFGSLLVIGGTAGLRRLLGGRIPWILSRHGGIVVAAFWGFLEASALAVMAGVPAKIAFTLGLNAALTGSGARDWWRKSRRRSPHLPKHPRSRSIHPPETTP